MRIFVILYFILYSLYSFSQFNIIVEDSTDNHLYEQTIIENNNQYTIINGSGDSLGNRGISIIRTDSIGSIIWKKTYSKNGESWYEGYNYNFLKEKNVLAGSRITDKRRGMLMFFDNNYDTIFTKIFYKDSLTSLFSNSIKTYDNNILCIGQIENLVEYANGLLVKYDMLGNVLWYKDIGNASDDMLGKKTIETFDSSIVSIGYTYVGSTPHQDWYIVKTDSLGNLKWWKNYGNSQLNDGAAQDIVQTKDSCFVVVGGKAAYYNVNHTCFDGRIMKLDNTGHVVWDKSYRKRLFNNPDTVWCEFYSIVELDDGGFYVVGQEKLDIGGTSKVVKLYRFNSDGDTLWSRKYCTRCEIDDTYPYPETEYAKTIQKTNDGGFLIGGWGYYSYIFDHPYTQQMFLIKTDSLGCDGTEFSCPTVIVQNIMEEDANVVIYPNPAHLSVSLMLTDKTDATDVFIYDVYGRIVKQYKLLSFGEAGVRLDVSSLQAGVYFVKIGDWSGKFVKE
jgi:hypothetical protein